MHSVGLAYHLPCIDGLVKERRNSSALAMELRLSCTNPSIYAPMEYIPITRIVECGKNHYNDVIISTMASEIISLTIVYSSVYSGADQRKHQSSASLAFVREIHRGPVNFPHEWPVTRKIFPFDYVIMMILARFQVVVFQRSITTTHRTVPPSH